MSDRPGQIGEFWLSQNRHGTWCRTWFDHRTRQTRRAALGADDFESAMIALARWYTLNEGLDHEKPADVPLSVVLERYVERHAKVLPSYKEAKRAAKYIGEHFGAAAMVASLTVNAQAGFEVALRDKGLSDGYIRRVQTTLKAAVNLAYRNQEIASAPFVRLTTSNAERTRLLTLDEAAALFNAEPPEHLFGFLLLAFNTLSRPEALLELQPFQVDLERRLIHLNPSGRRQTKKYRPVVPITDTLLPWLEAHRTQRYLVQWHEEQAEPMESIKKAWRLLRARAKLSADVVPYTIRHTMASELRRRGVPAWEVSGILGHRVQRTSEVYAKFAPDYLGKAAAAIDDYMNDLQPLVRRELVVARPASNVVPFPGRKA